jgi:hypothetical protein
LNKCSHKLAAVTVAALGLFCFVYSHLFDDNDLTASFRSMPYGRCPIFIVFLCSAAR